MTGESDAQRRRHDRNVRLGRDLARQLAGEAVKIAATLDSLAAVHESVAGAAGHPLARDAAERAAGERLIAARERAASEWFGSIADGSYRPARSGTYRLPSQ